jgi:hypothetical protein
MHYILRNTSRYGVITLPLTQHKDRCSYTPSYTVIHSHTPSYTEASQSPLSHQLLKTSATAISESFTPMFRQERSSNIEILSRSALGILKYLYLGSYYRSLELWDLQ